MSMLPPWKVTETRYDEMGRVVRVLHHTRIGSVLMGESDARGLAAQETARYANSRLRRTFRAAPMLAPVVTYETAPGHTIAFLDGDKFGAVWGPLVDDPDVWAVAWTGVEPHRVHTRAAAERELTAAVRAVAEG